MHTVIPSVLRRQHQFLDDAILQEVCGVPSSLVEEPTLPDSSAEPLEIPVDPLLLQSLTKSLGEVEQSIISSHVTISADEEAGKVMFSPTKYSKSSWKEECQEKMLSYISSNLAKESITIPKEAAAQAMSAAVKLYPSLTVVLSSNDTVITLAGAPSSVQLAKKEIESVCLGFALDTATILLSPADFDFLEQIKKSEIPDSIECKFNSKTFQIYLKGPVMEVSKLKESVKKFLQHVDITVIVDPLVIKFFRTEGGRSKLKMFLQERQCQAALHFSIHPNLTLHLLCRNEDEHSVNAAMQAIPLAVTAQAITIPESVAPVLSELDDFNQLCQKVEKENGILIKNMGCKVSAAGFKLEVSNSLVEINNFLKEKASPLPPTDMKIGVLVARSLKSNQQSVEKCLQSLHVELHIDISRGVLQLSPMHYLMPGWEETCKKNVTEYIKSNVAEMKVEVPQNANHEVLALLYSMHNEDSTFVYNYPHQSTSLTFAGEKNTVKTMEDKLAQICANFSVQSEEVHLNQENFEFLTSVMMEYLVTRCQPHNVEVDVNNETHSLCLTGPVKELEAAKKNMTTMAAHVAIPVSLEQPIIKYFVTERGKDKLYKMLRDSRYEKCVPFISASLMKVSLLCQHKHKKIAEEALEHLQTHTSTSRQQIPDLLSPFLADLPEFVREKQSIEEKNSVQISVSVKEMLVAGFKNGVTASVSALSAFVGEKMVHFQPLIVSINVLIAKCIEADPLELNTCLANMQVCFKIKSEKSTAFISLSPTPQTKPGWKKECNEVLISYLERQYLHTEIEVPKSVANEVFKVLYAKDKNFEFELCKNDSCAIVAGEISAVKTLEIEVARIFIKHQTKESIQLTHREYDFFTQIVQSNIRNVQIECNPTNCTIVVSGNIREVIDLKKSIKEMVIHSMVPVSLDAMLIKFFNQNGKQEISAYVNKEKFQVAFHSKMSVHPPVLEFLCELKLESYVRQLATKLPEECQVSAIPLPKSIITQPMDKEFTDYCQQLQIEFHVLITINQNEVKICGFRSPVIDVKKLVESFIKKKCTVKTPFPIHAMIWCLFSGHMKSRWMKIEHQCQSNNVHLTPQVEKERNFTIVLIGDKIDVQKICQSIEQLIQSVITHVIPLTSPGLHKFFSEEEKGKLTIPSIENAHKVRIEVAQVGDKLGTEQTAIKTSINHAKAPRFVRECVADVGNMKHISIYIGDISEFRADVIVNAANEKLKHVGGVADSILKKGGDVIQEESDKHVRYYGSLKPGEIWMSSAVGKLPCYELIHAVGPRWQNNPCGEQQLQKVTVNCLKEANCKNYHSIALPAISSGIFCCPINDCAKVLISTVINFCMKHHSQNLQEINFVLYTSRDATCFIQALHDHLRPENIRQRLSPSSSCGASWSGSSTYATPATMPDSNSDPGEESSVGEEECEDKPLIQTSPLNRIMIQQGSILEVEVKKTVQYIYNLSSCGIPYSLFSRTLIFFFCFSRYIHCPGKKFV